MNVQEFGELDAKTHFSELISAVEQGEQVFITRDGKRVAELKPVQTARKAVRGCAKGAPGTFYMAPDFDEPLEDFKDYM